MLAILTFLASGPGGALIGLLIKFWDKRSENKLREKELETNREMSRQSGIVEHLSAINKGEKGEIKELPRHIKIWFIDITWTAYKAFSTTVYSPFSYVIGGCLLMLVTTLCGAVVLFALEPWWNFYSLSPEGKASEGSVLFGLISWTGDPTKPVALNAGGAAFYLLAAINFTITTAIVGTTGQSRK